MATARDICTRALKRLRILAVGETPSADQMADALAALNDMIYAWTDNQVDVLLQAPFSLDDTFTFWVPPEDLDSDTANTTTMDYIVYQGGYDASSGTLPAASIDIRGDVYRVTVAGSALLDGTTSTGLAVNNFIVCNGVEWLIGKTIDRHIQGVIALLALRLSGDYGDQPAPMVSKDAADGWDNLLLDYFKHPVASFDRALIRTPARRNNFTSAPGPSDPVGGVGGGNPTWEETVW